MHHGLEARLLDKSQLPVILNTSLVCLSTGVRVNLQPNAPAFGCFEEIVLDRALHQGTLQTYTDEAGQEPHYATDSLGRTTKISYPDETDEEIRYEAGTGFVAATKDRAGQWLSFAYDAAGHVTEVHRGESPDDPLETRYE